MLVVVIPLVTTLYQQVNVVTDDPVVLVLVVQRLGSIDTFFVPMLVVVVLYHSNHLCLLSFDLAVVGVFDRVIFAFDQVDY